MIFIWTKHNYDYDPNCLSLLEDKGTALKMFNFSLKNKIFDLKKAKVPPVVLVA